MLRGFFLNDYDHRARLRVRAFGPTQTLDLTFEIDTGASEELFVHHELAEQLGLKFDDQRHLMTLADGTQVLGSSATMQIDWIDGQLPVEVTVWPRAAGAPRPARQRNRLDGLIGHRLLRQSRLSIDYINRKVVIERPAVEET